MNTGEGVSGGLANALVVPVRRAGFGPFLLSSLTSVFSGAAERIRVSEGEVDAGIVTAEDTMRVCKSGATVLLMLGQFVHRTTCTTALALCECLGEGKEGLERETRIVSGEL